MDAHSDAGSAVVIEVEPSPSTTSPWTNKYLTSPRRQRTTRRKRKPMTSPQPSHISRRCNNCGVTKTPQWREGPDGPKTLCNACGVKYSRERQDKSKSRKSRKLKAKIGSKSKLSYSCVNKRTRNSDRDRRNYDIAFLFSSTTRPTTKLAKVSSESSVSGFSGKEYAAALSLVSLAILGGAPPPYEDDCDLPKTRRSKRIALRSRCYGEGMLETDEWIPHLLEELQHAERPPKKVAMGVPCVWAAMGYTDYGAESYCPKQGAALTPMKKIPDSDRASSASDSAKSDFLTT